MTAGGAQVDRVHRPVVGGDHPGRDLPGDRRGDQAQRRFQRLAQRVVGDQPGGVGVVGGHDRLAVRVSSAAWAPGLPSPERPASRRAGAAPRDTQPRDAPHGGGLDRKAPPGEARPGAAPRGAPSMGRPPGNAPSWDRPRWDAAEAGCPGPAAGPCPRPGPPSAGPPAGPHPLPQLGGGLPGEGEAEHPFRPDHAVGDQPDQPGRHRLALARAGPGDHGQRLRRCGDDRGLLARWARAGRAAGPAGGAVPGMRRHGVTCSPARAPGSWPATGQIRQPGFTFARNSGPAMPAATVSTSSRAQSGSGSSARAAAAALDLRCRRPCRPAAVPRRPARPGRTARTRQQHRELVDAELGVAVQSVPAPRSAGLEVDDDARPSASRSSRSTRPVISTAPTWTRKFCSYGDQFARVLPVPGQEPVHHLLGELPLLVVVPGAAEVKVVPDLVDAVPDQVLAASSAASRAARG